MWFASFLAVDKNESTSEDNFDGVALASFSPLRLVTGTGFQFELDFRGSLPPSQVMRLLLLDLSDCKYKQDEDDWYFLNNCSYIFTKPNVEVKR